MPQSPNPPTATVMPSRANPANAAWEESKTLLLTIVLRTGTSHCSSGRRLREGEV
jgi:hypothetical protein